MARRVVRPRGRPGVVTDTHRRSRPTQAARTWPLRTRCCHSDRSAGQRSARPSRRASAHRPDRRPGSGRSDRIPVPLDPSHVTRCYLLDLCDLSLSGGRDSRTTPSNRSTGVPASSSSSSSSMRDSSRRSGGRSFPVLWREDGHRTRLARGVVRSGGTGRVADGAPSARGDAIPSGHSGRRRRGAAEATHRRTRRRPWPPQVAPGARAAGATSGICPASAVRRTRGSSRGNPLLRISAWRAS